jgi:hypothetical protein
VHPTQSRTKLVVSADGHGVVSHAGSPLPADLSDVTSLTAPSRTHCVAIMLADGGEVTADLALQRDQAEGFGPVASTPTAWRLLAGIDSAARARLRSARATARDLPGLVLDLDATLITSHSEKEQAAATCTRGFGYHPRRSEREGRQSGVFGPRSSRLTQPAQALGSPTGCRDRYNGLADVRAHGQKTGIRTLN